MGILGFQSHAPLMLGNLAPYTHYLCPRKTSSFKGEAGLTSIKWPKNSGSRVLKSEALSRAKCGMKECTE